MSEYNWTVFDLQERLLRLYKALAQESDIEKRKLINFDIKNLENIVDDFMSMEERRNPLLVNFQRLKDNYPDYRFLRPEIWEFHEITADFAFFHQEKRASLSKKDLMELTHDFYKTLNSFFFGNFMKSFRRRFDHVLFALNFKKTSRRIEKKNYFEKFP